jgi:hypothetical protein
MTRPTSTLQRQEPHRGGVLQLFYDQFESYLSTDDSVQFFSNRKKAGNQTYLSTDIYSADKLSTVILEEYAIRGKMGGYVIVVLPNPDTNIPIFTFQLGGTETRSIALLDISPTQPDIDYAPIIPVYEKFKKALGVGENNMEWVKGICSPYLLHAQYEEIDTDLFLEAMQAYLKVWIEHYYLPGIRLTEASDIEHTTNAIYKYKRVQHDNDPAYGIFTKEWGGPVADAFFYIETRDEPSLPPKDHSDKMFKHWENPDLNVLWERRAQEQVMQAPEQVQQRIIDGIEAQAVEEKMGIITLELFDKYKDALLKSI